LTWKPKGNAGSYVLDDGELTRIAAFLTAEHRPWSYGSRSLRVPPTIAAVEAGSQSLGNVPRPKGTPAPAARPSLPTQSRPQAPAPPRESTSAPTPAPVCQHCRSSRLSIDYGRYGYYFKCVDCRGNTSIDAMCPRCGDKRTIHKDGVRFTAACKRCATTVSFYTNRT